MRPRILEDPNLTRQMKMEAAYLIIHAIITLGALIGFLIRNEHRITAIEVNFKNLKNSHDILTNHGTLPHGG